MVNTFVLCQNKENLFDDLDKRRLGKQRVEAMQIINILEDYDRTGEFKKGSYGNHPATQMWIGYTNALKVYFNLCVKEWIKRGCVNNMALFDIDEDKYRIVPCEFDGVTCQFLEEFDEFCFPKWFSFPPLILSHRASLLRKDPDEYHFFNDELTAEYYDKGYLWPLKAPDSMYDEWNFNYLDPIGTGAPAQFKISEKDAARWVENPTINPTTNRTIKPGAKTYKEYQEAAKYYKLI